jgi:SAM-dependent methyltransferase
MSSGPAEFDEYSAGYAAGMENPVKALVGNSAEAFIAVKLRWLMHRFPEIRSVNSSFRMLDYGCGIGTFLRLMSAQTKATLMGCDISSGMLQEAKRTWPDTLRPPEFHPQEGERTKLPDDHVDLITVSAVLHHVPPGDRPSVYREIHRILRPGGRVVVFEHNPLNPITRYVVARTPIDRSAVLLRATEVQADLRRARFVDIHTGYLMFMPPRLTTLSALERLIGWLPFGAQYATVAHRSS